jgi:hypothetical protein
MFIKAAEGSGASSILTIAGVFCDAHVASFTRMGSGRCQQVELMPRLIQSVPLSGDDLIRTA